MYLVERATNAKIPDLQHFIAKQPYSTLAGICTATPTRIAALLSACVEWAIRERAEVADLESQEALARYLSDRNQPETERSH